MTRCFRFFICLAILLAIAATPLLRAADTPPTSSGRRIATLDGMRGFLALAVVFHHASIYHRFLLDGIWLVPPSHFYRILGPLGVSLFFMITGFLFWSQMIRRNGRPEWFALYVGRVFRIGPLYLAAACVLLGLVFWRTGMHLHEPLGVVLMEIGRWLSIGLLQGKDVNTYQNTTLLLARVTWTLHYEWLFYLSLPVLAVAARSRQLHLPFVVLGLVLSGLGITLLGPMEQKQVAAFCGLFLLGMLTASLSARGWLARLPDWAASSLVVLLLIGAGSFAQPQVMILPLLMLGGVLYLVVSGASLFGLLTTRAAIRLGDVSYGIYLLQGLVLIAVFETPFSRVHEVTSPLTHWLLTLTCSVVLVLLATLMHVWIERPGVALGRHVVRLGTELSLRRKAG